MHVYIHTCNNLCSHVKMFNGNNNDSKQEILITKAGQTISKGYDLDTFIPRFIMMVSTFQSPVELIKNNRKTALENVCQRA